MVRVPAAIEGVLSRRPTVQIMERCRVPFETNGDLSHYVFRGHRSSGPVRRCNLQLACRRSTRSMQRVRSTAPAGPEPVQQL